MNLQSIFTVLPVALLFVAGCSNDAVGARKYQAAIETDNFVQVGSIAFPEYDVGGPEPVDGSVDGNAPILSAAEVAFSPDDVIIEVKVRRSAADEAAYVKLFPSGSGYPLYQPAATCNIMRKDADYQLVKCVDTSVDMTLTLTPQ